MLSIYAVILDVVRGLRPVIGEIERKDPDLGRQMRRATSSVALNVSEGMYSRGRSQAARYHTAMGSMRETLSCIEVGIALGYVNAVEATLLDQIDRIVATLYKLST
ncbi:MAG: four helix bundle protein [Polyangiaceae bacterium]|jgi:four helix bundle protein